MFSHAITYQDLDGNDVTEEFHFHVNKVEALEFAAKYKGSPGAVLMRAFEGMRSGNDADDNEILILKFFRELLAVSVGRRSESGKSFIKTDEISSEFMNSDAYSNFFFDLMSNEKLAMEFINKVFPKDMVDLINASEAKRSYTDKELLEMSDEEFARVAGTRRQDMSKEHLMIAMQRLERRKAA